MNIIKTDNMPQGGGHYSTCIEHNGLLYLSGQLPLDLKTKAVPATIEEQTELVLNNIEFILREVGVDRNAVLQARVYVSDIAFWPKVNAVYAAFFGEHRPVRCIIPCGVLNYGCLIEIEVVAVAKKS